MADVAAVSAGGIETDHAEVVGDTAEVLLLVAEEAELAMARGTKGGERVLDYGGKGGIGHNETAGTTAAETVGEKRRKALALPSKWVMSDHRRGDTEPLETTAVALGEEVWMAFSPLWPKRRVAHIVGQTGSLDDGANLLEERSAQFGMAFRKLTGHIIAERLAQRRHLKGVGEAVMDEDGTRKREHLSLVLKTAGKRPSRQGGRCRA